MIYISIRSKAVFILLLYLLLNNPSYSQESQNAVSIAKSVNEFLNEAIQNYQKKDYRKSAEKFEKALSLKPNHPAIMYNAAALNSLVGNGARALGLLNKLASMKLIYHPEADSDFLSLWNNPDFQIIVGRFGNNTKQIGEAKTAFQLDEKDLITEGINYNPKTKKFYVSSIHKRKIISIDERGNAEDFIENGQDGIWGVFGMAIDTVKGILWVSTSAVPQIQRYNKSDSSKAGIFKYHLDSGKLIKKYILEESGNHLFGDLSLSSNGDVFISDSRSNKVYVISHKKDQLEVFLQSDDFVSPQGITLSKDNNNLFLADYAFGIYKINITSKKITRLNTPDSICVFGIDGIYFYNNSIVAVQNGTNPNRIIRLSLDKNTSKIKNNKILAANFQPIEDPTLGVINGNIFYFIANSQWNKIDNNGLPQPYEKWNIPAILKVNLDE